MFHRHFFLASIVWASLAGRALGAGADAETDPADQANVPVKEVVLFSSGVGYFEHSGTVHGDGGTTLHFKTDQINDILKSLLLEDLDGGKVGTVSYPNPAPLARTLASFQVDITSNPPLTELLNQLRGGKVSVVTLGGPREGIILGVEKRRRVVGERNVIDEFVLNLKSGTSVRPILLEQVQSLEMDDAKLNQELDAALTALAQARGQDKKPVDIQFNGQGDRRVRIANEQARIRENMKAVAPTTDYYARLVKKLDEQETQIEGIQKEVEMLSRQLDSQRKGLQVLVERLTIA